MNRICFTYNWNNKLSGKIFTTIRLKNPKHQINETYEIFLKKGTGFVFLCHATIMDIRHIKLSEINEFIAGLDTGYSAQECQDLIRTMYKSLKPDWDTQVLSFILLRKESIKGSAKRSISVNRQYRKT
jgi:hypothetical protein